MKFFQKAITAVAAVMLALTVAIIAPTQAGAAPESPDAAELVAWDDQSGASLLAWECSSGNVCFWTGSGGTGSRCMWSVADPNWVTGAIKCSWAATSYVRSVMNRGTSSSFTGVAYYLTIDYDNRIGCTKQGNSGNLAGTYELRSHRWITTSCG